MNLKIVFRVDSSVGIGSGHFVRCLSLAEEFSKYNVDILFITSINSGSCVDQVAKNGFKVELLPHNLCSDDCEIIYTDAYECSRVINLVGGADLLIVDSYYIDKKWERILKLAVKNLLVIDDLENREHECQFILDQNLIDYDDQNYLGLLPKYCKKYFGPRYALIRAQFHEIYHNVSKEISNILQILIMFGGSDPTNETQKVLEAINQPTNSKINITVIFGRDCPHKELILNSELNTTNVTFLVGVDNMASEMSKADIMIGAGGGSVWERCSLGLPSISIATANNQISQLEKLAEKGALLYLGESKNVQVDDIKFAVEKLIADNQLREGMRRIAREIVDAKGASRVVSHLIQCLNQDILLREVVAEDCEQLLTWRNEPAARMYSTNKHHISLEEHLAWFLSSIKDVNQHMFIGLWSGHNIGIIRFHTAEYQTMVSITLDKKFRGIGLGARFLMAGCREIRLIKPLVKIITAEIDPRNLASIKTFVSAGFTNDGSKYVLKVV